MSTEAKSYDWDELSAMFNTITAQPAINSIADGYDPKGIFGEAWIRDGRGGYMSVPLTVCLQFRRTIDCREVKFTSRVFCTYCLGSHIHGAEPSVAAANCGGGDYLVMDPEDRIIHSAPFPRLPWGLPETPGFRRPTPSRSRPRPRLSYARP